MSRVITILLISAYIVTSGCVYASAPKTMYREWEATGGSRADATVELSYEMKGNERSVVDDAEGEKLAKIRCQSWGYADAEPFGGVKRMMNGPNSWLVTKTYQCIGQGSETTRK